MDIDKLMEPLAYMSLATGCLPQPIETRVGVRVGYTGPMFPTRQYRNFDALRRFVPRGKCQSSVPACNWYTTGKAYQTVYAFTTGKPYPEVSYCAGYQEATGGDFNAGTLPIDSIRAISERGLFPASDALPEWFNRPRLIPADAVSGRKLLRADEWEEARSAEEIISALLNADVLNIGIDWYAQDVNPGPTGHLGLRGRLVGGHSVLACGVVMDYANSPSRIGILFNNHHGDSMTPAFQDERGNKLQFPVWGDDGFGVVPIERVVDGAAKYGAWVLRTVMMRGQDLNDVPVPNFHAA